MPYIGLRPFEWPEAQVSAMLRQLEDDRLMAVVGSSGSGKSSLVRAGLLPAIREGRGLVEALGEAGLSPERGLKAYGDRPIG